MKFYKLISIDLIVIFSLLLISNLLNFNVNFYKYYSTYKNIEFHFDKFTNKNNFINNFGSADSGEYTEYRTFVSLQKINEKKQLDSFFYDKKLSLFENNNVYSIAIIYSFQNLDKEVIKSKIANQLHEVISKLESLTINTNYFQHYIKDNDLYIEHIKNDFYKSVAFRMNSKKIDFIDHIKCNPYEEANECRCWLRKINIHTNEDIIEMNIYKIISIFLFIIYLLTRLLVEFKRR